MTSDTLNGVVQSGGTGGAQPIANAVVTLHEANAAIAEIPPVTTGANGAFSFPAVGGGSSVFYLTAKLPNGAVLAAIIGPDFPAAVTINELTTVGAAYAFAQFWEGGLLAGDQFGLQLAAGMAENLVNPVTGQSSDVLTQPPNGDQTNSLRSTRALANLIAPAARQELGALEKLLHVVAPNLAAAPEDTLQALIHIARHPQSNVDPIYALTKQLEIYTPALASVPDAWTLAVKVNDTGSDDYPFSGPGNLVFDEKGYAWITNNSVQGEPYSSTFLVVLKPNGKPADGSNGTPNSPITDGGLLGGGFGIDIDPSGNVWASNFGWGGAEYQPSPTGNGSVSAFGPDGTAMSGDQGFQGGVVRAQGIACDPQGNIWIASYGNNQMVVFLNGMVGDPSPSASSEDGAFDVALAGDGSAWLTCSGGLFSHAPSNISKYSLVNNQPTLTFNMPLGHSLKGMSIDSKGNVWAASGGDNAVYLLSPEGELLGKYSGGGVDGPWSATVDGDDNIWVANFGAMVHGSEYIRAGISKLAGVRDDPSPLGYHTGDPISPSTGFTLPSGGDPVTLANGDPLYGPGRPPSYSPLQRQTNLVIDQAGNVWAINNWKPSFTVDAAKNPGGDGIVIFVGLAKPPTRF